MEAFLAHPAVQGGVAPFVVGLIVVVILAKAKLAGLAVTAGFAVAVALASGFAFTPLTATRKVILLGLLAPLVGIVMDFALNKRGRTLTVVVALACGALTVWVFWSVLRQRPVGEALLVGGGMAVFVAWLVGSTLELAGQPVRAGAAALMLGLGTGVSAILGASALLGLYGIAIGAGAGAFLLAQMLTGRKITAGATLTLSASVAAGLVGAAALVLAQLPWYALLILGAIPLAARLPASDRMPVWAQAFVVSAYGFAVALVAFLLTWRAAPPPG
jgi:hypothetical protein